MNTESYSHFNGYLELEKQCSSAAARLNEKKSQLNQIDRQIQTVEQTIDATETGNDELVSCI